LWRGPREPPVPPPRCGRRRWVTGIALGHAAVWHSARHGASLPVRLFRRSEGPDKPAWSVVDVETTGLHPRTDRIVEMAFVRLDAQGREIDTWTTLVDPQRDVGASRIHGITARDLRGAPTFTMIADEVLARMAGTVLVAHNVRFDAAFIHSECTRAGYRWGPIDGLCTMTVAGQMGIVSSRSLVDCCTELGIDLGQHHTALDDARAAAGILTHLLPPRGYAVPRPAPPWPTPASQVGVRLRTDPPAPRSDSALGALASRVGAPAGLDIDEAAAVAYLALLDRVLEDRHLTTDEVEALAHVAADWGISVDAAVRLHLAYMSAVWQLARADGVVTKAEHDDIETIAALLGVPVESVDDAARTAAALIRGSASAAAAPVSIGGARRSDFAGQSVCFTGESVCSIGGVPLSRADQERLAAAAGMVVKGGVSGRLDMLVLADPDSASGKAQKAATLGVRCIAELAFWRAIDVPVD